MKSKLFHVLLIVLILFISCRNIPDEEINQVRNNTSEQNNNYLITGSGDTILTGIPIQAIGKKVNPDSISKPRSVALKRPPKIIPAYKNVKTASKPNVVIIPEKLTVITPGENGVPLPKVVAAKGKIVAALQPPPVRAQDPQMKDLSKSDFRYLDIDQGMNSSNVWSVFKDSHGQLWFGTIGGGVSRYDGTYFTHYTENEGLSNNTIWDILEDRNGHMWFATFGGGVTKYDGNHFVHFTTKEGLVHNNVSIIMEDSKGHIWIGTNGGGASRYDGINFTNYTTEQGIGHNDVLAIFEDSQGDIWFGSGGGTGGLNRFDGTSFTRYTMADGLSHNDVWSMAEDSLGQIWIATAFGGVNVYDSNSFDGRGSFTHYTVKEGLLSNWTWAMYKDSQGHFWFGHWDGGVTHFNGREFTHYNLENGFTNKPVMSIEEDKQGNIWFGTLGEGVIRLDQNSFTHYTNDEAFGGNSVLSLVEDTNNDLWIGTVAGGLNLKKDNYFYNYNIDQGLPGTAIISIDTDTLGRLWYATGGSGIVQFDNTQLTFFSHSEGLTDHQIQRVFVDSHNNLWTGSQRKGITYYDNKNFTHYSTKDGISSDNIGDIFEDSKGNIWFSTNTGGVIFYDGESFINYSTSEGLGHNNVQSIFEDSRGIIWVCTAHGLSQFNGEDFSNYTSNDGLISNFILSMNEDKEENLWITTNRGINILKPVSAKEASSDEFKIGDYQIIKLDKTDGLNNSSFPLAANGILLDYQNQLWFACTDGLKTIDLNKFSLPTTSPQKVELSHIEINQQFVGFRRLSDTSYQNDFSFGEELFESIDSIVAFRNYPINLNLPYELNHLTFYFSALDWAAPHDIKYSFWIDGYDSDWSLPQSDPKAEYRNLPHGTYDLQIKAIGKAQVWSDPYVYSFVILPPWWHTYWAYALYILAGLFSIYGVIRWRTANLNRRRKELEQTVTERTAEVVAEKERSDNLLLNILPAEIAEELKKDGTSPARDYEMVTVLFTDFKQFTVISEQLSAQELVAELNVCFKAFDDIITKYEIEKIKTIGDAYMAAGGLNLSQKTEARDVVLAALEMQEFILERQKAAAEEKNRRFFEMRCGIHTGSVVAGIVGVIKFQYDIWGDAVNLASRMESYGEEGKVNVSQSTYEQLKDDTEFTFIPRGKVKVKNKGEIEMYFVERQ